MKVEFDPPNQYSKKPVKRQHVLDQVEKATGYPEGTKRLVIM